MITSYKEGELPKVLELVNRVQNHLTAGIVSNDQHFLNEVRVPHMQRATCA